MVHWTKPRVAVAFARSKRIDGLMLLEIELSLSRLAIEYPIVCLSFHFPRNYFRAFIGETKSTEKGVVSKKWEREGGRMGERWKYRRNSMGRGEFVVDDMTFPRASANLSRYKQTNAKTRGRKYAGRCGRRIEVRPGHKYLRFRVLSVVITKENRAWYGLPSSRWLCIRVTRREYALPIKPGHASASF